MKAAELERWGKYHQEQVALDTALAPRLHCPRCGKQAVEFIGKAEVWYCNGCGWSLSKWFADTTCQFPDLISMRLARCSASASISLAPTLSEPYENVPSLDEPEPKALREYTCGHPGPYATCYRCGKKICADCLRVVRVGDEYKDCCGQCAGLSTSTPRSVTQPSGRHATIATVCMGFSPLTVGTVMVAVGVMTTLSWLLLLGLLVMSATVPIALPLFMEAQEGKL